MRRGDLITHKDCGGTIEADWSKVYEYEDDETGKVSKIPAYRCQQCGEEILGDAEVIIEGIEDR